MTLLQNSTWRCGCGAEQNNEPTTYAVALQALRSHQAEGLCKKQVPGAGDRIHSTRPIRASEARQEFDNEPTAALHGPPRPPAPRVRRAREGLPWLPGNGTVNAKKTTQFIERKL
ncbi:MAG TPA: hypothetical protein VGB18_08365 [Candidatus Thermoplasmatota archaeon]